MRVSFEIPVGAAGEADDDEDDDKDVVCEGKIAMEGTEADVEVPGMVRGDSDGDGAKVALGGYAGDGVTAGACPACAVKEGWAREE
jgi:hypothetical protein